MSRFPDVSENNSLKKYWDVTRQAQAQAYLQVADYRDFLSFKLLP
ncbi:MAG TPA: hypothetical protein VGO47_02155 [Chlamydiales bacterium]|nr:hypothetical protein [Chlamydiales bacterium]